jgi:hypothetical protein
MMLFTKNGWDATSVHALMGKVRAELKDPGMHTFTRAQVLSPPVSGTWTNSLQVFCNRSKASLMVS